MKAFLRKIQRDRKKGFCLSVHQSAIVQSQWLRLFATGGCYYPDVSEFDMLSDLCEHYEVRITVRNSKLMRPTQKS